jgi:prophage maintenance system killer protein
MMKEKKTFQPVNLKGVCLIYELLLKRNLVAFPISNESVGKIESIIATITGVYFGQEIYTDIENKAMAYLYFLIKDHPFTDGNKRTASLVFEMVCILNNLEPNYHSFGLDQLAVFIEKIKEKDHHRVIRVLSKIVFRLSTNK